VPSHSLALTLDRNKIRKDSFLKLNREDPRLTRYLKGETITVTEEEKQTLRKKGYIVIGASEYPLGFGKISGDGSVKNLYPKAWRLV
jgi:NOL1/NOP2/fmu family ribosome biogenesis protein